MPTPPTGTVRPLRAVGVILRTLPVLWRAEPTGTTLLAFVLVVQGLLPALTLSLTRWTVDEVTALAGGSGSVPVLLLSALWLGLLLLEPLLSVINQFLQGNVAERFTAFINLSLMKKAETLPGLDVLEDPAFYNHLKLLQEGARNRPLNVVILLVLSLRDSLSVLTLSAVLITLGWWVPLALFLATVPYTLVTLRLRDKGFGALISNSPEARAMEYDSRVALSHSFAQEVRLFNLFGWLRGRYERRFSATHQRMRRLRQQEATQALPASLAAMTVSAGLFAWAVGQASRGQLSVGQVVIVIQALSQVQFMMRDIVQYIGFLYERALYFDTYFAFMALIPVLRQPDAPKPVAAQRSHAITFENVTFRYPDGRAALHNVNCHIAAGETVAIVGENGAGKTTLIKLLLRFYDPTEGRILIDGTDLRELDLVAWRERIGAVFQSFNRYDYSIRENIALARLEHLGDSERLRDALHKAGLLSVVEGLEGGMEASLGKEFGGTELSGGQWQKLAIARVLFRRAGVLVLDEPTAALDPRSEHALYAHFAALSLDPTTFLITHRLSSVVMADRVLVLKKGCLVEDGTHASLLAARGEYAELWGMQAKNYVGKIA